jgi:hypothetical protein
MDFLNDNFSFSDISEKQFVTGEKFNVEKNERFLLMVLKAKKTAFNNSFFEKRKVNEK